MTEQALVHVVDDDPGVRDLLVFLLQSAGHAVRAYDSAAAFLAVAPGLQAGCVLTDVRMPGMDGLALQRRIAALGRQSCRGGDDRPWRRADRGGGAEGRGA